MIVQKKDNELFLAAIKSLMSLRKLKSYVTIDSVDKFKEQIQRSKKLWN